MLPPLLCLASTLGPQVADTDEHGSRIPSGAAHEIIASFLQDSQRSCTARLASGEQLAEQVIRTIPKSGAEILAHEQPVPFEAAPTTRADLRREFHDTAAFLNKTLSKDPRLKPADIEVHTDHMQQCTSCANYLGAWKALHLSETIEVGTRRQILADDWVVDRWLNLVRFMNPPQFNEPILRPEPPSDQRFGCPCSAVSTRGGGVRLYHTAKGATSWSVQTKNTIDEHAIVARESSDGKSGWSAEQEIKLRGSKRRLKTFVVAQPAHSSAADGGAPPLLYAGYEGGGSVACLASSKDGFNFTTLQPSYSFPKTTGQCAEHKPSFLGMAADAYVTPTVGDERDVVWYRRNFGTSYGWREIRGLQVAELRLCKTKSVWQRATTAKTVAALPLVRLVNLSSSLLVTRHKVIDWYFDKLGKLEARSASSLHVRNRGILDIEF